MNRNSLRSRMTFGFALSSALFAIVASVVFFIWTREAALDDARDKTEAAVSHLLHDWNGRTDVESVDDAFTETYRDPMMENVALLIVDDQGRTIGTEGHPSLPWPLPNPDWVAHVRSVPGGKVAAGVHWEPIAQNLLTRSLTLFGSALIAAIGTGVAAWFLVGRTLRPIGELTDQAKAISADTLHAHLDSPSGDTEMTHLVDTLNDFLDRLKENAKDREQFYASAAHELRTPLAVLSATTEIALSRPRSIAEHEETLRELQQQTRLLTKLAEDLLTLNRLNTAVGDGDGDDDHEPVDPEDICLRVLGSLEARAAERELHVETDFGEVPELTTSAAHTTILIRNLIENAVKYTPDSGWIRITVRRVKGAVRLEVANHYPDVDKLDFVHLFDPFYRGDSSRTSEKVGNGLGLPICRRLAALHGWQLTAQSEGDSIRFVTDFPLANAGRGA